MKICTYLIRRVLLETISFLTALPDNRFQFIIKSKIYKKMVFKGLGNFGNKKVIFVLDMQYDYFNLKCKLWSKLKFSSKKMNWLPKIDFFCQKSKFLSTIENFRHKKAIIWLKKFCTKQTFVVYTTNIRKYVTKKRFAVFISLAYESRQ